MGLLRDVRRLKKVSKQAARGYDPVAQMQAASAVMEQVTRQQQIASTGEPALGIVNAIRDTTTQIDHQPVSSVDVTVFRQGLPPVPTTIDVVGYAALSPLRVGARVDVRYDPSDPATAVLVGTRANA